MIVLPIVVVKDRILRHSLIIEGVKNEEPRRKIGIKGEKIDDMLKSIFNHSSLKLNTHIRNKPHHIFHTFYYLINRFVCVCSNRHRLPLKKSYMNGN